ncbi:TlpA family protein disulfide reductase [Roseateles saccharophilus]|uniref:Thiol-disulfide isomerase/thioredoxin n=1 Tax=Roseateles saccharophilus TaxID=304 RepID=A0A4R3VDS3_ROSSA|nr:TlpA disulfide reductase family protein [Roseateles saccharophilus]MDG0832088.1 TlpA family protein disulfide reductase [Roseateles saccharophilus]TCV03496.1 thiol-disulfide isomerase/thioredoxin [Roseateles saccharophilus]
MAGLTRRHWCQGIGGALATGLGGAGAAEALRNVPAVGAPLLLPDVPLLEGGEFKAASARGRVVVVYWWASWCPFCAQVTPAIQKLWQTQRERGLLVLGLSIDQDLAAAKAYRARRSYDFPCGWVTPAIEAVLPKPQGLPVTVVRGRDGRVAAAEVGQLFPEDVEALARFL